VRSFSLRAATGDDADTLAEGRIPSITVSKGHITALRHHCCEAMINATLTTYGGI